MKYDAEIYYREKILKTTKAINDLKVEKLKVNSGIGFVTFLSNSDLKSCLEEKRFSRIAKKKLTKHEIAHLDLIKWNIKKAPS